jgi:membrane-associated protease RseP (regulator of RpoE activity)
VKLSMIQWLAIAALLGLNAQAGAQQDAQAKPSNPDQIKGVQPNQAAEQYVQSVFRAVNFNQPETVSQFSDGTYDLIFSGNPMVNSVAWFGPSDRTAGMSLTPADDALRTHLSLPKDQGLIVIALEVHSPAALAGIQQNDVLLKLGEASLAKSEDLEQGLKGAGGKPAPLTILRGGNKLTVQVQPQVYVTMGPVQPEPPAFWIGISVSSLEPALRSQLKLPQNQGLLAIDVVKDSPAAKAEVKLHDILLSLAGQPLESQQKLVEVVQSTGEKSVQLEVIREGKNQTIDVTPQRRKADRHTTASKVRDTFYVVHPGALVTFDRTGAVATVDEKGGWIADVTNGIVGQRSQPGSPILDQKKPATNPGASASRLEEIDVDIKQLRKAIEELNKTLKEKK